MVLEYGPRAHSKKREETKTKPKADCKLAQKKYRTKNYMMHEQIK